MLPSQNRLTKEKDFEAVFSGGKSFRTDLLLVKVLVNNLAASRFGFVISKKVSNKATVRNKIKRRLRDIVAALPAPNPPKDIVMVVMPLAAKKEFLDFKKSVHAVFNKIT